MRGDGVSKSRRRLRVGLFVCLMLSWIDIHAGEVPASANGDVNGDRSRDIADVSYLLNWLFLGGPEAVPCESTIDAPAPLPDTGQTACYGLGEDGLWQEVPCEEAACPGQDGAIRSGCPFEGRFIDHGDDTVTDTCTGLMWMRVAGDSNGDGQATLADHWSWCSSLLEAEARVFAAYDDWRLPNVRELTSLLDDGHPEPALPAVFEVSPDYRTWFFWSSTSWSISPPAHAYYVQLAEMVAFLGRLAGNINKGLEGAEGGFRAWFVRTAGFAAGNGDANGDREIDIADATYLLNWLFAGGPRPVSCGGGARGATTALPATGQTRCDDWGNLIGERGPVPCADAACPGQDGFYENGCPMAGRFTVRGDGAVLDACTGLIWLQAPADVNGDASLTAEDRLDWCAALRFCDDLVFAGRDDWRLPNFQELASLVDYGRSEPGTDPVFSTFVEDDLSFGLFFSSTTNASVPEAAWTVSLGGDGSAVAQKKTDAAFVIAVRDGP